MIKHLLYAKLCFQRAQSHYGFLLSAFNIFISCTTALKVYGHSPLMVMSILFATFVFANFFFGHLDIKHGIAKKEQTIINTQMNPEIMEVVSFVREFDERMSAWILRLSPVQRRILNETVFRLKPLTIPSSLGRLKGRSSREGRDESQQRGSGVLVRRR